MSTLFRSCQRLRQSLASAVSAAALLFLVALAVPRLSANTVPEAGSVESSQPAAAALKLKAGNMPAMPAALGAQGIEGDALLDLKVDETGHVTEATIVSATRPEFGAAARAAALNWVFEPALRDGRPIARVVRAPFAFRLTAENRLELALGRRLFAPVDGTLVDAADLPRWPMPRRNAVPRYPPRLMGTGITGSVVLSFVVDRTGHTINIDQTTGKVIGDPEAAALCKREYRPGWEPKV